LGWGNSLLGFVALATGIGFPIFLWVYVSFLHIFWYNITDLPQTGTCRKSKR
jgi:hypothetical protein